MDRNEEFRKRLDKRLNRTVTIGSFSNKKGFDPIPYVDILMEKTHYEELEDDDLQEFIDDVLADPQFDFIFGQSSLLNADQKANTAVMLLQRVNAYLNFDPDPHAQDLIGIYGTPAFDIYIEFDEDGEEEYNFAPYFAEHKFTKEQKELVYETFINLLIEKHRKEMPTPDIGAKHRSLNLLTFCVFAILPPFFIPNFLQRQGWLPSDAGWFLKIGVGIVSFIALFYVVMKIITAIGDRALRARTHV